MERARFVVGIDGLEPSDAALAWALSTVAIGGEDLLLVNVIDRPVAGRLADCEPEELEEAQRLLDRAVERIPEEVRDRVATKVLVGPAAQTFADAGDAGDILVIGTHKTGFLHGRVTGSRGLVVASRVRARLVVVPTTRLTGRRGVVAGLIAGKEWADTTRIAGVHASRFDKDLRLIHAVDPSWPPVIAEDGSGDASRIVLAAAEHVIRTEFPDVVAQQRLSQRDAVTAFLDAARTATLLVIPVIEEERAANFMGSVAHDVLLNINAPVVLVPARRVEVQAGDGFDEDTDFETTAGSILDAD